MKKILCLLLVSVLFVPLSLHAATVGTITGLSGAVQSRDKSGVPYKPLRKGAVISQANWIKTGANGWVELTLNDKSKFTLSNNTEFEVTSFLLTKHRREGSFALAQGKLRASVVKFGGRQSGAAQGSKQWNDEFYRFSQAELAKQEAEAKKGMLERAADTARSGVKVVAGKVGSGWDSVKGSIVGAAKRVGTDPGLVAQIANFESGFNPDAAPIHKNPTKNNVRLFDGRMGMSSAHGLGQFTDSTWLETLRKHGGKHGVANASKLTADQAAKLRSDVELQAAMLAELTRENAERGRALGGKNDAANVYALHNLGEGDGAKFLKSLSANPGMSVRDALMHK